MNRIAVPSNARSRRTRAALLDAARAMIESGGIQAVTMAAVADRAGVTRRSGYLHFATRSDLMVALFERVATVEDLPGSLAPVWEASDAAAALEAWAEHLGRYLSRVAGVAGALKRERTTDADAAEHWAVVKREHRAECRRLAAWLEREQRLAGQWTVDSATDMLWVLMSVEVLTGLVDDLGWSLEQYTDHLRIVLRSTFLTQPTG